MGARLSTIMTHPKRPAIEAALRHGVSLRALSHQFGVSRAALHRHKRLLEEAQAPTLPAIDGEVIDRLEPTPDPIRHLSDLQGAALVEFNAARLRGDQPAAVAWIKELRALVELKTRLDPIPPRDDSPEATLRAAMALRTAENAKRIHLVARLADKLMEIQARRAPTLPAPSDDGGTP